MVIGMTVRIVEWIPPTQETEQIHEELVQPLRAEAVLEGKALEQSREAIYLEFHGIRFLYSQRAIVTNDGWKYVFTPGDKDECYNLNEDPGELRNLVETTEAQEKVVALRELLTLEAEKSRDPLCNAICKYFGQWFRNPTFQIQTSTI